VEEEGGRVNGREREEEEGGEREKERKGERESKTDTHLGQ